VDCFPVCGDTNLGRELFLKPDIHSENIAFEIEKALKSKSCRLKYYFNTGLLKKPMGVKYL
jgi:hypothetical protein